MDTGSVLGLWRGAGFATGHPLDGVLEAYGWYGKRAESEEDVHPLLFSKRGGDVVAVDPRFLALALRMIGRVPVPKSPLAGRLFQLMMPLLTTRRSRARLRMIAYRGTKSATMVYDQLPIHDVFRRMDGDTLLGLMDLKGMERPFFFMLHREHGAT